MRDPLNRYLSILQNNPAVSGSYSESVETAAIPVLRQLAPVMSRRRLSELMQVHHSVLNRWIRKNNINDSLDALESA